jgi:hypothetical protein
MKVLGILSALLIAGISHSAHAAEPQQKITAGALLMEEVRAGTVFTQTTQHQNCPSAFVPILSDYLPEGAKPGDIRVYFRTDSPTHGFTFEHNSMYIRPALADGKRHIYNPDLEFVLGAAYSHSAMTDKDGVLTTEYMALVGSVAMVASVKSKVTYDSNRGTIEYHFEGNGVDPVNCSFVKSN